jgi:hypothetical protein
LATGTPREYNPYDYDCAEKHLHTDTSISITRTDRIISELLATLQKDVTKEYVQSLFVKAGLEVSVLAFDDLKSSLDIELFVNKYDLKEKDKELVSLMKATNVGSFLIVYEDEITGESVLRTSFWDTQCGKFIIAIITGFVIYCLTFNGYPELRTFLIEQFTCDVGHLLLETQTLMSVESAPICGICLQNTNTTWDGYWWCTLCNQNK